jgi:uncharacterized membrane protein
VTTIAAYALAAAAVFWPMLLGVAVWARADDAPSLTAAVVYRATSHICHQRPERSFHTGGAPWPVCGRCAGLYLAAPAGALLALARGRRMRRDRTLLWLAAASAPTALTLGVEWLEPASVSNTVRLVAALPLGAMAAYVIVRTAGERPETIGYTGAS